MVSVHNPLNKKHSSYLVRNFTEKKNMKKMVSLNKFRRKNKHLVYDLYNRSENDFIEGSPINSLKRNSYSFSQYEDNIIPKTENNSRRSLKKSKSLITDTRLLEEIPCDYNSEGESTIMYKSDKEENSFEFQYGTLFGNEKMAACASNFLENWDTFISDISGEDDINRSEHYPSIENQINKEKQMVPNNSGYLTPTSQKDDSSSYEGNTIFNENIEDAMICEKNSEQAVNESNSSEFSPIIIDDFDDICPFENDDYEDERIRKILNADILPSDYIGKIPSIPEKPMGDLGKLMKKYHF
ncbi:hypothetical protein BCR32DRAFT_325575 [Anaeromyces robustus]|uniref:Uncharacterized protein n=1 Tax=Anaeromyces robustus TaxID=1754192 RepID=A0A1Y1XHN3_9FUNG|nr:hypothetical protein BCR32DRAFT_325575 [Anaeromyces robustus]|eukprot:ORX85202.1 hypothetical protein BCR32DRAFT_325575 [Anaeromyces robustus]